MIFEILVVFIPLFTCISFHYSAWQWKIKERVWYILNHIYALAVALTLIVIMNTRHVRGSALKQLSCWSGSKLTIENPIKWVLYLYLYYNFLPLPQKNQESVTSPIFH